MTRNIDFKNDGRDLSYLNIIHFSEIVPVLSARLLGFLSNYNNTDGDGVIALHVLKSNCTHVHL